MSMGYLRRPPRITFSIAVLTFTAFLTQPILGGVENKGLPRKPMLGAALGPISAELRDRLKLEDQKGAEVLHTLPGTPAEAAGLKPKDVVRSVDGKPLAAPAELVALIARKQAGDHVVLSLLRDGKNQDTTVTLQERPRKKGEGFEVLYDAVTSNGKRLRTVVSRPAGSGRHPALLLIQGLGNFSIDHPATPMEGYDRILDDLARAGYVTMRVDKPGCGDSEGGPWPEIDFQTELDGYRQGLKALKAYDFVDPERVFVFGHSMGGVMAPLLAAETKVKGIAVYGTVFRTWFEYQLENARRQNRLAGGDFAAVERAVRDETLFLSELYLAKKSPAEIGAAHPELEGYLKESIKDDRYMYGVNYRFFQQLANVDVPTAWAKTEAHVLALWGKGDYVAPGPDHELIAEAVNASHPGHGTYVPLNADHGFARAADFKESFARAAGGQHGEFNPEVLKTLKSWMDRVAS